MLRDYFRFGSSFCCHHDNYDKLKPYSLPICGAVDGFPRKVIWLVVCGTNNNPMFVAVMFVRAVKSLGLVSEMLRTDHGNKTVVMAVAHCTLMRKMLMHADMGYLLQTSVLKISDHISVAFLLVGFFFDLLQRELSNFA